MGIDSDPLVMLVQAIALFARPTPYGDRYLENWTRYVFYAPLDNLIGVVLLAAPFLLTGIIAYRRRLPDLLSTWLPRLLLGALLLSVMLDQADHEVMRFMGTHLTAGLLRTYGKIGAWGADVGRSLTSDRGGPGLPLLLLVASPAFLWWIGSRLLRQSRTEPALRGVAGRVVAVLTLAVLPVAAGIPHRKYGELARCGADPGRAAGCPNANAWEGHSLVNQDTSRFVAARRYNMMFAEDDSFSMVLDPISGALRLYEARIDPLQRHDIAGSYPEVVERLRRRATEEQALTDYLLEVDRVWNQESDRPRGTPRH